MGPRLHSLFRLPFRIARSWPRRLPPPWSVEDIGAAFVVKDSNDQGLAYVYYEDEPQRRVAAKMRIAANIAKLPKQLKKRGAPA
jgi:hypothetical protein